MCYFLLLQFILQINCVSEYYAHYLLARTCCLIYT